MHSKITYIHFHGKTNKITLVVKQIELQNHDFYAYLKPCKNTFKLTDFLNHLKKIENFK